MPVCLKTTVDRPDCPILDGSFESLQRPSVNLLRQRRRQGYYRSRYDSQDYQQLLSHIETSLTPPERITFLGSQWAQTRAGIAGVDDFMHLASAVRDDSSPL